MLNTELIQLLERVLGKGTLSSNNQQIKFYCPFCHHHKQKFEVCIDDSLEDYQKWNCWVCSNLGHKGKTIYSLFKKLGVNKALIDKTKDFPLKSEKEKRLQNINNNKGNKSKDFAPLLTLPEEFKPLYIKPTGKYNIEYKHAYHYITKIRKLTDDDLLRYNIGYCESGKYNGMIIIPSYDANNQLNYFVGRSYNEDASRKHQNPDIKKDIIGFENTINWNYPIILVEGSFDAIVAKRNAIPLFGKTISDCLKKKIIQNKVQKIYISLDNDALKDIIPIIKYFMSNGITVYTIILPEKDPADLGYKKFIKLINTVKPTTFSDIIKLKLSNI